MDVICASDITEHVVVVVVPLHFTQVISERPPWTQSGALGIQTGGEAEGATPPTHLLWSGAITKRPNMKIGGAPGNEEAIKPAGSTLTATNHSPAVESVFKGRRLTNRSPPPLPSHWGLTILQATPPKLSFFPFLERNLIYTLITKPARSAETLSSEPRVQTNET
jgi:hypothetical protein